MSTLISVTSALTEPKTVLAGAILEVFPARFMVSTAASNAEIEPSRPLASMAKTRGSCGTTARRGGCEEGTES